MLTFAFREEVSTRYSKGKKQWNAKLQLIYNKWKLRIEVGKQYLAQASRKTTFVRSLYTICKLGLTIH